VVLFHLGGGRRQDVLVGRAPALLLAAALLAALALADVHVVHVQVAQLVHAQLGVHPLKLCLNISLYLTTFFSRI